VNKEQNGSALIIVLWSLAVMAMVVLALITFMDLGLDESATRFKDFRALQLAESGVALGLHPKIDRRDSLLNQTFEHAESFSVKIRSEGGRLNINVMLLQNREKELTDLFQRWGMDNRDADVLVDHLLDWVDGDSLKRLNGAEEKDYEETGMHGFPPNRPFQSVEEMSLVPGMEQLVKLKPEWRDYFTVWNDGKLDMNEAPADLIAVVCKVGSLVAERVVKHRLGRDEEIDTDDDFEYADMAQVRMDLGLPESLFKDIQDKITLKSDYRRIESTGRIASHQRRLVVVARLNSNPIQYLVWMEQ
jgi:type II secretory pathway component PulK